MAGEETPPVEEVVGLNFILDGFTERLKKSMAARGGNEEKLLGLLMEGNTVN